MIPLSTTSSETSCMGAQASLEQSIEDLVDQILHHLTSAAIPYVVLRNREGIPASLARWSDIDMMVPNSVTQEDLTVALADLHPAQVIRVRDRQFAYFLPVSNLFVRLDVFTGDMEWRGAHYADHRAILSQCREDRGIFVASPVHQAFIAWFSKLLWKGAFPHRYTELIERATREDPVTMCGLLENAFGADLAVDLFSLATAGPLTDSNHLVHTCRSTLWLRQLRQHPVKLLTEYTRHVINGINLRLTPSGLEVALLGPDGAGKSTIAERLTMLPVRQVPFGEVRRVRLYRHVLPSLTRLASIALRRPLRPAETTQHPHEARSHHPAVWFLKYAYYTLDQWLDQARLRSDLAHGFLVVKDRHLMELTVDAKRYRYDGPPLFARLLAKLAPKPELVIVLDAPPNVLIARKQDITLKEIERQRRAYRALATSVRNGFVVDANRSIDEVFEDVISVINRVAIERSRRQTKYCHGRHQFVSNIL